MNPKSSETRELLFPLVILAVGLMLVVVLRTAWVCDDALITFRVVLNFWDGYGLTWNPGDRVQAYTHPLWLLLLLPFGVNVWVLYYWAIALSLACLAGIAWVLRKHVFAADSSFLLWMALCLSSRAWVDFSTSGLESPLTNLLLACYIAVLFAADQGPHRLRNATMLGCFLFLTRPDAFFLIALSLAWEFHESRKDGPISSRLGTVFCGAIPLGAWLLFSLVYYGALVPNTALAKLGHGIPQGEIIQQGFAYFLNSLRHDPFTLAIVFSGLALATLSGKAREKALGAGGILFLAFIAWIGGDFMGGRFFTPVFFLSTILLVRELSVELTVKSALLVTFLMGTLAWSIHGVPDQQKDPNGFIGQDGIADERFYYSRSALLNISRDQDLPEGKFQDLFVKQLREESLLQTDYLVTDRIGISGILMGSQKNIIDMMALSDPFLARLPALYKPNWRIGHFSRPIPDGYPESLLAGESRLADPNLALLFNKLQMIRKGSLFGWTRLVEVLKLQAGYYDSLVDSDDWRFSRILRKHIPEVASPTHPVEFDGQGIEIGFPPSSVFSAVVAELSRAESFRFEFRKRDEVLTTYVLKGIPGAKEDEFMRAFIPITSRGLDNIRIIPLTGESVYLLRKFVLKP